MYIESVPNRNSPPAVLLRESFRVGSKVRKRTILNLSKWPPDLVEGLRTLLKGGTAVANLQDYFAIVRSRPHGHVAAVLGSLRSLGLDSLIDPSPSRSRSLAMALVVSRILQPRSKLATSRCLDPASLAHSLGDELQLGHPDADDLYAAMDWLLPRQHAIEQALAKRHLSDASLVLADVTSTYLEGSHCPLAARGHSRDGKRGKLQIVFSLLCNRDGCPVAVQVFPGNTADPATVGPQLDTLRRRFGRARLVVVGDRGLLTEARIRDELRPAGLDWISALRAPAIRELARQGAFQMSLFDHQDLAAITSPDYPGERLLLCRNPLLAAKRARQREALLAATEKLLDPIVAATQRTQRPLRRAASIGLRVGKVVSKFKVRKHFELTIEEGHFDYRRNQAGIDAEAALDGLYVVRTSVAVEELGPADAVRTYKSLSAVERAFRSFKTVDLKVRPIYHYLEDRVRAHVLVCMLAYYVEWHMQRRLAPLLFKDADPDAAQAARESVVQPAQVSPEARAKARTQRTAAGEPVHSFQTLLADLATIVKNRIQPHGGGKPFDMLTRPTELQRKALELLGVSLTCTQ